MKMSIKKTGTKISFVVLFTITAFLLVWGCKKTFNDVKQQAAPAASIDESTAVIDSILQVSGRFLRYPNGDTVILHGVNVPVYHSGYVNDLDNVASAIKNNTYVNAVRIPWYSKQVLSAIGNPPYYSTYANLDSAISIYASKKILPIVDLHDLTALGDNSVTGFNKYVVKFWTDTAVLRIIRKHKNHIILNLANEWGATWAGLTGATFVNTYGALIQKLRTAGLTMPIMIDAPDGGANSDFLIANGQAVINKDVKLNIILSVHTYWSQENGAIVNCPADYVTKIKALYTSNLPFILGEVSDWAVQGSNGQDHESTPPVSFACPGLSSPNKYAVNYNAILPQAMKYKIGFFAWTWYQDGLIVRNIYNQNTGLTKNTSTNAGSWPNNMLSATVVYGLKNPALNNVH